MNRYTKLIKFITKYNKENNYYKLQITYNNKNIFLRDIKTNKLIVKSENIEDMETMLFLRDNEKSLNYWLNSDIYYDDIFNIEIIKKYQPNNYFNK